MTRPIYVDFDNTLGYAIYKDAAREKLDRFIFRPGAHEFLAALRPFGDIVILTMSIGNWAKNMLSARPDLRKNISDIIPGEKLDPVQAQLEEIFSLRGLSDAEKIEMVGLVRPIADGGVIFDDTAFWSEVYFQKAAAVGTFGIRDLWIQVSAFSRDIPDAGGLQEAFFEFKKRNSRWNWRGIRRRMFGMGDSYKKGVEVPVR